MVIILISLKNVTFTTIIVSYLANNILTTLICIFSGWAQAHSIRHKSIESMKQLAHFGKFSVGTSIGASLLRTSDTFIIKLMFPIQLLGVYYIPQRLLEIFEIPMRSFVSTALPGLSAAKQRGDDAEVATIMKRYAGLLTVVILPISLVTFLLVGVVIHILFGNKYSGSEANNIFRIFLCYVIIMPIDRFFGVTLDVMNKPYLNMMKVFLMLGVNIVADIIGIYLTHSLYGVAVASLFTYYTGLIFGYVQLKKHLNFSMNDILSLGFQELKNAINNFRKKRAKV